MKQVGNGVSELEGKVRAVHFSETQDLKLKIRERKPETEKPQNKPENCHTVTLNGRQPTPQVMELEEVLETATRNPKEWQVSVDNRVLEAEATISSLRSSLYPLQFVVFVEREEAMAAGCCCFLWWVEGVGCGMPKRRYGLQGCRVSGVMKGR